MKPILFLVAAICLLLATPSSAKSYLCIGEQGAGIEINAKTGRIFEGRAGPTENKYVVSEEGLKFFGIDAALLDRCSIDESGIPFFCERGNGWSGDFWMRRIGGQMTFVYIGLGGEFQQNASGKLEASTQDYFLVAGKCSAIGN